MPELSAGVPEFSAGVECRRCNTAFTKACTKRNCKFRPGADNYKEIRFVFRRQAVLPRTGGTHLRPMATGCLLNVEIPANVYLMLRFVGM